MEVFKAIQAKKNWESAGKACYRISKYARSSMDSKKPTTYPRHILGMQTASSTSENVFLKCIWKKECLSKNGIVLESYENHHTWTAFEKSTTKLRASHTVRTILVERYQLAEWTILHAFVWVLLSNGLYVRTLKTKLYASGRTDSKPIYRTIVQQKGDLQVLY